MYDTLVRYIKKGHTCRCTLVWARYASGIQEPDSTYHLVTGDMRVTMQQNITIVWRGTGSDMLEAKANSIAHQIDRERPVRVAIAISPNERDRRTDRAKLVQDHLGANIAQVPDFVHAISQSENPLR